MKRRVSKVHATAIEMAKSRILVDKELVCGTEEELDGDTLDEDEDDGINVLLIDVLLVGNAKEKVFGVSKTSKMNLSTTANCKGLVT